MGTPWVPHGLEWLPMGSHGLPNSKKKRNGLANATTPLVDDVLLIKQSFRDLALELDESESSARLATLGKKRSQITRNGLPPRLRAGIHRTLSVKFV